MKKIITSWCLPIALAFLFLFVSNSFSVNWKQFNGQTITFVAPEHPVIDGVKSIIDEFESQTGIKVNLQTMAEDLYFDRMNVNLRSGDADVYFVPMDGDAYIQNKEGLSQSLSGFINDGNLTESSYDINDFPSSLLEVVNFGGEFYAIPASIETYILMYNKEIVDKHLKGKVPTTMNDLIKAANKIKKEAKGRYAGAVMRGIRSETLKDTITGIVFNSVGDMGYKNATDLYFSDAYGKNRLNDRNIQTGISRYAELMKAGPPNIQSMDWPDASRAFQLGKAAFFIDANLFGPGFEASDSPVAGKVGYAVLPIDNREKQSYSGYWGWGYGISAKSKNPQASWLLIQWISSKKNEPRIGVFHGGAARQSTWANSDYVSKFPKDFVSASREQMKHSRSSVIRNENEKEFYLAIVDAIQDIYSGTATKKAFSKAIAKVNSIFN